MKINGNENKTHRYFRRIFCFGFIMLISICFIGCQKKEHHSALDEETEKMFPQQKPEKPKPKIVDIKDVARMIIARKTGRKGEDGNNTEYEIVIRDSDGRNEKVLAKRLFFRFTDDDLVWIEELNAILYMGTPIIDSEEGLWLYDYKNNTDKILNENEGGFGGLTIAADRKYVFFVAAGRWYKYDIMTGEKKFIHAFQDNYYRKAIINPEGTLVGGRTETGIFVEDVTTKKRYEWIIQDSVSYTSSVCFSKNLKYLYFEKCDLETGSRETFFSPIILRKKLNPINYSNWNTEYSLGYYFLSNDGKYFYSNCGTGTYRLDISQNKIEEIAFVGWGNPFHIIEKF